MGVRLSVRWTVALFALALTLVPPLAGPARAGAVEDAIATQVGMISDGRLASAGGVAIPEPRVHRGPLRSARLPSDLGHAARRAELSAELAAATRQGFRPEDFATEDLAALAAVADAGDPGAVAAFDIAATEAAARLLRDLYYGKVDPATLDPDWGLEATFQPGNPAAMVNQYLEYATSFGR